MVDFFLILFSEIIKFKTIISRRLDFIQKRRARNISDHKKENIRIFREINADILYF